LHDLSGFRYLHDNHEKTFKIKRIMFFTGCPISLSTAVSYLTYAYYCWNFWTQPK
jgi:hypothetical protein